MIPFYFGYTWNLATSLHDP